VVHYKCYLKYETLVKMMKSTISTYSEEGTFDDNGPSLSCHFHYRSSLVEAENCQDLFHVLQLQCMERTDPEDRQAWRGRLRPRLGSQAAPSAED